MQECGKFGKKMDTFLKTIQLDLGWKLRAGNGFGVLCRGGFKNIWK